MVLKIHKPSIKPNANPFHHQATDVAQGTSYSHLQHCNVFVTHPHHTTLN